MTNASPAPALWDSTARLPVRRLLPLVFRSFFLQGSWSYERMQSVGWTAVLAGEGRRLAEGDRAAGFLQRHLSYFNTNPVMASYLIGGVVRLEEEVRAGRLVEEDVARFKRGLVSPLAAWGDTFFWASLRPAATAAGAFAVLLWGGWGAVVYLLAYNSFHLFFRIRGILEGYRWGPGVSKRLAASTVRTSAGWVRASGLFLCGALVTLGGTGLARTPVVGIVLVAGGLAAFFVLRRRAGSGTWLGLAAVLAGLVYAWVDRGR